MALSGGPVTTATGTPAALSTPTVTATPATLTFTAAQSGTVAAQPVVASIANPGSNLAYTITNVPAGWTVRSSAGTTSGTLPDTITVTPPAPSTQSIGTTNVSFVIDPGDPAAANVTVTVAYTVTGVQDQLIFDPAEENTGTPLPVMNTGTYEVMELTSPAPPLLTATVGQIGTEGARIAGRDHDNRAVTMRLEVRGTTRTAMETALRTLEEKVGKLAAEGGTLRRVSTSGETRTLDILAADSYEPVWDIKRFVGNVAEVTIGLVAKPYARKTTTKAAVVTGGTEPLTVLSFPAPGGDAPALATLTVERPTGIAFTTWWGLERYDPAANVPLSFAAESCTLFSGVTTKAVADASGGTVVRKNITTLYDVGDRVLSVTKPATGLGAHRGDYRVFARVRCPAQVDTTGAEVAPTAPRPQVFAKWSPSVDAELVVNAPYQLRGTGAATFEVVDLGTVAARGDVNGNWTLEIWAILPTVQPWMVLEIDHVWLLPVSAGWGEFSHRRTNTGVSNGSDTVVIGPDRAYSVVPTITDPTKNQRKPRRYTGVYMRVPPSRGESRWLRLLVKQSFGDSLAYLDLSGHWGLTARVTMTERYLSLH